MITKNLPIFATTFVGRQAELAEIGDLLAQPKCRLITLVGAGGMGKTRLAVEAASQQTHRFSDGVVFVAFQPLHSVDLMVTAMAEVLGLQLIAASNKPDRQQLFDYLHQKELLLLLDNFEHVLAGADLIAALLDSAIGVKTLVTSRMALNIQHEWLRPVLGMSFPDHQAASTHNGYSAIQLFAERAQQVQQNFALEAELPYIIQICQLVGGMPLGIELAVAWLRTLACADIAKEIQHNLDMLETQRRDVPERQRSIRAVFDSSLAMLTPEEQTAFMRLSVFRGTPTREAIQTITGASLPLLSSLVDKALLTRAGENRYQMHDLLRQYAEEKLTQSGLAEETQQAHSRYYLNLVGDRVQDLWGRAQTSALDTIEKDFENLRTAWYWAVQNGDDGGISAAVEPLCMFLWMRWRWSDGRHMLAEAQRRFAPQVGETPRLVWGKVLSRYEMDVEDPLGQVNLAMTIAQHYEDAEEIAMCYHQLANLYAKFGQLDQALLAAQASLPYFQELCDPFHEAAMVSLIGMLYRLKGQYDLALNYTQRSVQIARDTGDLYSRGFYDAEMGMLMFIQGDFKEAERVRARAEQLAKEANNRWQYVWLVIESAGIFDLGVYGDIERTRQRLDAGLELIDDFHIHGTTKLMGLMFKSLLAAMEGDYLVAREMGEAAYPDAATDAWEPIFRWGAMSAAAGLQDYEALARHNQIFLRHFYTIRVNSWLLVGITFAAILASYRDKLPQRATELLALAFTHPHSLQGWLRVWELIRRLTRHLEAELGSGAYAVAWERGKTLNLEETVQALLIDDYLKGTIPTHIQAANSTLVDPLSERELEVLGLITAGYSNQEIAAQLVIGVTTVKKHITHIYDKLDVDSRTRAVLRAKELQLI